jgi:hypothetical protein
MSDDVHSATVEDLQQRPIEFLMTEPLKKPGWAFVTTLWARQAARDLFIAFEEALFNTPDTCDNYHVAVLRWPRQSGMIWFVAGFPMEHLATLREMALKVDLDVHRGVPAIPDLDTGGLEAQFPLPDTDNVFCLEHKNGTAMLMFDPKGFPGLSPDGRPKS